MRGLHRWIARSALALRASRLPAASVLLIVITAGCSASAAPLWTWRARVQLDRRGGGRGPVDRRRRPAQRRGHADDHRVRPRLQAGVDVRARRRALRDQVRQHRRDRPRRHLPRRHEDRGRRPVRPRTGEVDVPAAGLAFLCSIPGHAAAGMQGTITVAGATAAGDRTARWPAWARRGRRRPVTAGAAPVADPNAPAYVLHDPRAPKVLDGRVHDIDLPIIETDVTSPRASSCTPGPSAARSPGRRSACTSATRSTCTSRTAGR